MIFFVYMLQFSNGKYYIGMSRTDSKGGYTTRFREHTRAAKNGRVLPIYNAWRKHGSPEKTVLSEHDTLAECALSEVLFIETLDACNPKYGYNILPGGAGMHAEPGSQMYALMRARVWDNPSWRAKLSLANKGKPPSPQAIAAANAARATPEGRAALRKAWECKERRAKASLSATEQMTPAARAHLSALLTGRDDPRSDDGKRAAVTAVTDFMQRTENRTKWGAIFAKAHKNPETVAKFEAGRAAWRTSERNRKHCAEIAKLAADVCSRKVLDIETGVVYASQQIMAIALGTTGATISRRVKAGRYRRVM